MASPRMSPSEFRRVVEEALASLPEEFQRLLENIAVTTEDEPSEEDLAEPGMAEDDELLGTFRGVARTDMTTEMPPMLPNCIVIFRGPILRVSETREEAIDEIRETVIHELGHFFGLDDEAMPF